MLAPFAAGYFLTYMLRAVNAVVAPDLVGELGLGAAELGLLTASYLGAFALFQLPLGVLLDRYGPRRVQAALFAVAAAGCALFAIGGNAPTLTLARGMIGLGFAGGLMSAFKANVDWVPAPRRALANASVMSFGALGLLTATTPTEFAVGIIGWRAVFAVLAAVTVVVALVILAVVPERKAEPAAEKLREQVRQLGVHLQGPRVPGHRSAARHHCRHPHRHPDLVGGTLVPRRGAARPHRGRQLPLRHRRRLLRRHPLERRDRRLVRAPRRQRAHRDDRVPAAVLRVPGRNRLRGARASPARVVRLRHERAGGGAGLPMAFESVRRGRWPAAPTRP